MLTFRASVKDYFQHRLNCLIDEFTVLSENRENADHSIPEPEVMLEDIQFIQPFSW